MTANTQQKQEEPPTLKSESACSKTNPTESTLKVASCCLKRSRTADFPSAYQPKFTLMKKIRSDGDLCFDNKPIEKLDIDFKKLEFSKKIVEEPTQNTKITTITNTTVTTPQLTKDSSTNDSSINDSSTNDSSTNDSSINDSSTNTNINITTTNTQTTQTTQTAQYHSSHESSVLGSSGTGSYQSVGSPADPELVLPRRTSLDELNVNSDQPPIQFSETDSGSGEESPTETEEFSLPGSTAPKEDTVAEKEENSS